MKIAVSVYDNLARAEAAVSELGALGIPLPAISLLAGAGTDSRSYIDRDGQLMYVSTDHQRPLERGRIEDATSSAGPVAGLGGAIVGSAMLGIPGVGPILAAGPLFATIVAGGAPEERGGEDRQDFEDALTEAGVPADEARRYVDLVVGGHAVVLATVEDELLDRVQPILDRHVPLRV